MRKILYILLAFILISISSTAQSFEGDIMPETVQSKTAESIIKLSDKYFKDGTQSLHWVWNKEKSVLQFSDPEIKLVNEHFRRRGGIEVWVCNEKPQKTPLIFQFKDESGTIHYTFDFNLDFTGWRAVWIAYSDMWTPDGGRTNKADIVSMDIVSPENSDQGEVWLDRMAFVNSIDLRATPDAQVPDNNRHVTSELWHWVLLHKWERAEYDIDLPKKLSRNQRKDLRIVRQNLIDEVKGKSLTSGQSKKLERLINLFDISLDGTKGAPLMQNSNVKPGDVHYGQLNDLIDLSARSWYIDKKISGRRTFVRAINYMLHQGFAYESGMGTNHHYGYQIRDMAGAILLMKDVLEEEGIWDETRQAITYWVGLQEVRQPFKPLREGVTDTWNTLLIPRLTAALMKDTEAEQYRAIKVLSRWVDGSLQYTPGTVGGLKVDGTAFHHGGHYPGYSVPGFSALGQYLKLVNGTTLTINDQSKSNFKFVLMSMARQMNLRDWGLAGAGRHPLPGGFGALKRKGVEAYAYAAMAFDPIDSELAGQYLRLIEGFRIYGADKKLIALLKKSGVEKADDPQGFYVYNYASLGTYRYENKMVNLKGFSNAIWGSEIYTRDNRFGRYQSYGSIQIIGTPTIEPVFGAHPITEQASRYVEAGWDWNRNPGTTTIHLPLQLLNSPFPGTDMLRQPETFSGANSFDGGKYGMFAMKLGEKDSPNFTPSFSAKKSVFCFDNRIIALGSDISNDNNQFMTETTLFQQSLLAQDEPIYYNGKPLDEFPYAQSASSAENNPSIVKSLTGEVYYIPANYSIEIERKAQHSKTNKTLEDTEGDFVTCYFNHGNAPRGESYEYMVLLNPTEEQVANLKFDKTGYTVLQKDEVAHIVVDLESNIHGFAIFEDYESTTNELLAQSQKELMIMMQQRGEELDISVCDPYLYLGEVAYTVANESAEVIRSFTINGEYNLTAENSKVSLRIANGKTFLDVKCQHGIPVEFSLKK